MSISYYIYTQRIYMCDWKCDIVCEGKSLNSGGVKMKYAYKMEYVHPVEEKSTVELVPYSKEYQGLHRSLYPWREHCSSPH